MIESGDRVESCDDMLGACVTELDECQGSLEVLRGSHDFYSIGFFLLLFILLGMGIYLTVVVARFRGLDPPKSAVDG